MIIIYDVMQWSKSNMYDNYDNLGFFWFFFLKFSSWYLRREKYLMDTLYIFIKLLFL